MTLDEFIKLTKVLERGGSPTVPFNLHDGFFRFIGAFDSSRKASAFLQMIKEADCPDLTGFPIEDDMPSPPS